MAKLIAWLVVAGIGGVLGFYNGASIGRLFRAWFDPGGQEIVGWLIFAALTIAAGAYVTKFIEQDQRGAITNPGRRVIGMVLGLPYLVGGVLLGYMIIALGGLTVWVIGNRIWAWDSSVFGGSATADTDSFDAFLEGLPWPVFSLVVLVVIVVSVTWGLSITKWLKEKTGQYSKPLRNAIRMSQLGSGGSASFAGIVEEWRCHFGKGDILLGTSFFEPRWKVGLRDDRGLLTLASTRSGKGRSAIIPNLLTWPGSALVIDPKGTNAAVTAHRRAHGGGRVTEFLGQDVYVLDPFRITPWGKSEKFNPLSAIDMDAETVREDIDAIADALIVSGSDKDAHWDESAKAIISGLIAHLLMKGKDDGRVATLLDVRSALRKEAKYLDGLFGEMALNNEAGGLAAAAAATFSNAGVRERGSFFTTIMRNTAWLDSLAMQRVLGGESEFLISQLKEKPTTIYVVLPPELLDAHSRFMRLFVNLSLQAASKGGKGEFETLYILDEFFSLGKLDGIQRAAGGLASYGVRLWPIVQNLTQLHENYAQNWETFFSGAGAVQAFGVNDMATADYLVRQLGRQTIKHGVQKEIYNLREADEIGRDTARELGRQIVFRSGDDPLLLKRIDYDKAFPEKWYNPDPDFSDGYERPPTPPHRPPPPPGEPTIEQEAAILSAASTEAQAVDHAQELVDAWLAKKEGKEPESKPAEKPKAKQKGKKEVVAENGNGDTDNEKMKALLRATGLLHPPGELPGQLKTKAEEIAKANGASEIPAPELEDKNLEATIEGDALEDLERMIGLASVKQEAKSVIAQINTNRKREEAGLKVVPISRHLIFTGNPGTGKTTVARIIGDVYRQNGLLEKGHLVEVERGDVVGRYVGHTAPLMKEKCEEALDGVLFIDEAYSLAPKWKGKDFGGEAIEALMTFMENNRDRIVVIAAGYRDEMDGFLESNPGLKSRFGKVIDFPDYEPEEMEEIFRKFCEENEYGLAPAAKKQVKALMLALQARKGKNFGNGRTVRNAFQACLDRHNLRLNEIDEPTVEELFTLKAGDIIDDVAGIE